MLHLIEASHILKTWYYSETIFIYLDPKQEIIFKKEPLLIHFLLVLIDKVFANAFEIFKQSF